MNIFSERLKELRKSKNLSCKQLANEIGVSDATICRWENNINNISCEDLAKLAKYFGVSADYLIGLEN